MRFLKTSKLAILSDNRPKALNKATISFLVKKKSDFKSGEEFNLSEKRIFKAVPSPVTCNLPHKRHLSHPTQSMILDMLRKWSLNSIFRLADSGESMNMTSSLKCWGNDSMVDSRLPTAAFISWSWLWLPV